MPYTPEELDALKAETYTDKVTRLRRALSKLPPEQRNKIDDLAMSIVTKIKAEHPNVPFSLDSAYELLAALGVWMPKDVEDGE